MGENKETRDFNVYYLNFSKVYEMAMIINNHTLKSYQKEKEVSNEVLLSHSSRFNGLTGNGFLSSVKASISSDYSKKHTTNSKVVESIEVQTTKSTLLRRILSYCKEVKPTDSMKEGDLLKLDNVKLQLLNEESSRQLLILKKDALKGLQIEGIELNNLVSSVLQDYSYVLVGSTTCEESSTSCVEKNILIKIPMESQAEFESKYKIDDILIGKVSIIGIYKGKVDSKKITANTFSYFQEIGKTENNQPDKRIKHSDSCVEKIETLEDNSEKNSEECYDYIDVLAIVQDINFKEIPSLVKLHWWNRLGLWLSGVGKKNG